MWYVEVCVNSTFWFEDQIHIILHGQVHYFQSKMSVSIKRSLCPDGFRKALRYSTFERIFYSCNSHSPWELLHLTGGGELWSHWGLLGGAKPAIVKDAHKSTISKGHGYVFHDLYYTYCNRIVYIYWSILHCRCTYTKNVEPRWIVFILCKDEKCAFWDPIFASSCMETPVQIHSPVLVSWNMSLGAWRNFVLSFFSTRQNKPPRETEVRARGREACVWHTRIARKGTAWRIHFLRKKGVEHVEFDVEFDVVLASWGRLCPALCQCLVWWGGGSLKTSEKL